MEGGIDRIFGAKKRISCWKKLENLEKGLIVNHTAESGKSCARRGVQRNVQVVHDRCKRNELMTSPKQLN